MSSHKERIDEFVDLEMESSYVNHFICNFNKEDKVKVHKLRNTYKIWKSDRWSRFIYSVFTIRFNTEGYIVEILEDINPVGKIIKFIFLGLVGLFFANAFYDYILYSYNEYFLGDLMLLGVVSLFFFAIYKLLAFARRTEKNMMRDQIKIKIGLETEKSLQAKKDAESEWTGGKILTRLIMYPLSLFLIFVSVYVLFFERSSSAKGVLSGTAIAIMCLGYLVRDIMIILKKRK